MLVYDGPIKKNEFVWSRKKLVWLSVKLFALLNEHQFGRCTYLHAPPKAPDGIEWPSPPPHTHRHPQPQLVEFCNFFFKVWLASCDLH